MPGRIRHGIHFDSREQRSPERTIPSRNHTGGIAASGAGNHQVLVKWCLHDSSVGNAQDGIGLLDVVSDSCARFRLTGDGKPVVKISANSEIEGPIAHGNRIHNVKRELLDVGVSIECEKSAAAS